MRAGLVNRDTLHRHAAGLGLGATIRLGEGEAKSGGAARPSILADALEAVLGAIFLDAGYAAAHAAIERIYADDIADADTEIAKDPKTRLQEWLQGRRLPVPEYAIVEIRGEAHLQTFEVACRIAALATSTSSSSVTPGLQAANTASTPASAVAAAAWSLAISSASLRLRSGVTTVPASLKDAAGQVA